MKGRVGRVEDGVHYCGRGRVHHERRMGAVDETEAGEDGGLDLRRELETVDPKEGRESVLGDGARRDEVDEVLRICGGESELCYRRSMPARVGNGPGCSSRKRSKSPCSHSKPVM